MKIMRHSPTGPTVSLQERGNASVGFLVLALILLIVIFGPLITIWAINTLFPVAAIPYTFWTWLAALCLGGVLTFSKRS